VVFFVLPSLRNTRKHDKTKKSRKKLTIVFLSIFFDMDFLQKCFYGGFELPLPRKAQGRTKKETKKKNGWWVGGSGFSKCMGVRGGGSDFALFLILCIFPNPPAALPNGDYQGPEALCKGPPG
jgi:hypothetical protein